MHLMWLSPRSAAGITNGSHGTRTRIIVLHTALPAATQLPNYRASGALHHLMVKVCISNDV